MPFDGSRQTDFVLPTPGSSYIVQNPSSEQVWYIFFDQEIGVLVFLTSKSDRGEIMS